MRRLLGTLWQWMRALILGPKGPEPENTIMVHAGSMPAEDTGRERSLRIPRALVDQMRADLHRPHAFAHERVGFLLIREAEGAGGRLLLASRYEPLREDEYLDDPRVGARINRNAIRRMLALALTGESIFHVHLHEHSGMPAFSAVDECNLRELIPSFCGVAPRSIHGALLLSDNQGLAWGWKAGHDGPFPISTITIVGAPLMRWELSP